MQSCNRLNSRCIWRQDSTWNGMNKDNHLILLELTRLDPLDTRGYHEDQKCEILNNAETDAYLQIY